MIPLVQRQDDFDEEIHSLVLVLPQALLEVLVGLRIFFPSFEEQEDETLHKM
jgi:hypothetical protein